MSSVNEIFGQIGAAKIFAGGVSSALGRSAGDTASKINDLDNRLSEEADEKKKKLIQKKKKRLEKLNKKLNKIEEKVKSAEEFLAELADMCDFGKREIINFIANYITVAVPALEISVKGILLANIKKMVSCSINPMIPDEWREKGVIVNEFEIDPRHTLYSSPYSKWGKYNYFGIFKDDDDNIGENPYSLPRAKDMNAFMWYVKNMSSFANPLYMEKGLGEYFDGVNEGDTLYSHSKLKEKKEYKFLPGCTFMQNGASNTLFMVQKKYTDASSNTIYDILPTSNAYDVEMELNTINWFKTNTSSKKDKPLFSLGYSSEYNNDAVIPKNNFVFKILPKPFSTAGAFITDLGNNINTLADVAENEVVNAASKIVGGVEVENAKETLKKMKWPGIASLKPHVARFNGKGEYDKKGTYSINEKKYIAVAQASEIERNTLYKLVYANSSGKDYKWLIYDSVDNAFYLSATKPTQSKIHGTPISTDDMSMILTECYFGKTVYEFNYDYLSSFKLFDAKVITANVINGLFNINIPNPWKTLKGSGNSNTISNRDQAYIDAYVDRLVEKMITQEDSEFIDCFYNFSNEDYTKLEEQVYEKIRNGTIAAGSLEAEGDINAVYDILDAYNADASLEEQVNVLTKALESATEKNTVKYTQNNTSDVNGTDGDSSGSGSGISFVKRAMQLLSASVVNGILTPKVLMLIQINQKLLNDYIVTKDPKAYSMSIEDVLNALSGLLSGVIKEIIDSIQKELLRIILARLNEIMSYYMKELALEYAKKWIYLLKILISALKKNTSAADMKTSDGNGVVSDAINRVLSQVDYADIDSLVDEIIPNTKNC